MRISVIGTGYVGLVTGACLADQGHQVICVEKKRDIIAAINCQRSPIYEPGLAEILARVVTAGRLQATSDLPRAVRDTQVSIIAVGTPYQGDKIDLGYVKAAAREIGMALRDSSDYHLICVKSTVVPTTTGNLVKSEVERASGLTVGEFGLAMNPEFLREGNAVSDFMYPDRIVLGVYDDESFAMMKEVYASFDAPIVRVNLSTAEMIKYTANALLATLVSYANEVARICEVVGDIDAKEVMAGVSLDKRFNPRVQGRLVNPGMIQYLWAGCGFGGSCFPKDVKALISFSKSQGYAPSIIEEVIRVNREQPQLVVRRLEEALDGLAEKRVVVLGLAFKPGTDDVRESPSIAIVRQLLAKGARVVGVDPVAVENMAAVIPRGNVCYTDKYREALTGADAALLVTPWPEFVAASTEFPQLMAHPLVMDCRRVLDKEEMEKAGAVYLGVGLVEGDGRW